APAIVGVDLDPVGAVSDLIAHHARETIDAVSFFRTLRHAPLRRITLWSITARRDDRARDDEHSRAGNDPLFDCLFQTNVRVARAFGAEIANRGEAGHERVTQVVRGPRGAQGQRLVR